MGNRHFHSSTSAPTAALNWVAIPATHEMLSGSVYPIIASLLLKDIEPHLKKAPRMPPGDTESP
jgi:hypothetical protein